MKKRRTNNSSPTPPNPAPFPYADYIKALNDLQKALQGPCFYATVVGDSGMGKTSLMRDLSSLLDRSRYQIVYLSSAQTSAIGLVRFLAQYFHIAPKRCLPEAVYLFTQAIQARNAHLLLWLDEADRMHDSTLSEVRMLAEADPTNALQSFSVVLSGLPSLTSRLDTPMLFPLKRRILLSCQLNSFKRDELIAFLIHRFGKNDAERIPAAVHDELFERTGSNPALIDRVVHLALSKQKGVIDADFFRSILDSAGL